jgi:hypothetical protein
MLSIVQAATSRWSYGQLAVAQMPATSSGAARIIRNAAEREKFNNRCCSAPQLSRRLCPVAQDPLVGNIPTETVLDSLTEREVDLPPFGNLKTVSTMTAQIGSRFT